uniref:Protein Vpu n=1 Tax=Human immunodeficiency virus type 1 TaxID=11676 RepID=A0A3Q8H619_HV1|nr:vpu protein [Human immunodeficiency virus 1]QGV15628.1 vpu protein [Human immunodeficiency virus 1]QGV15636.1 vpu protein [Human immunodeficiency virus 1]QGV15644.1 vpu protein [Human immunodeficiency virus 1]QGV15675.1 vpu protein [Human immunodeficiency virus 1]
MKPLEISAIAGLVVAIILAIVVWTIVALEYRKIQRQRKIDRLIKRIREREEDSGNENEGDTEDLAKLLEMGNFDPWVGDNL